MERYTDVESRRLLPQFMQRDRFDVAMSEVFDWFGKDASDISRPYSTWNVIDLLDSDELDELADEMGISYYYRSASIEEKRSMIRESRLIQRKLGTKWALEKVIGIYFSSPTKVIEWFDYEDGPGSPNHFLLETPYTKKLLGESSRFTAVLSGVKRKSSVIDKIRAVYESSTGFECGAETQCRRTDVTNASIQKETISISAGDALAASAGSFLAVSTSTMTEATRA